MKKVILSSFYLERSNARLMAEDEDDESRIEKALDICRKVLIALLVFLGLLYYVTYEYDETYFNVGSSTGKVSQILI